MESETTSLLMPDDGSPRMTGIASCIVNLQADGTINVDFEASDCKAKRETEVDIEDIMQKLSASKEKRNVREDSESLDGQCAHIFVCYSSDDRLKVLPIVAELEDKFNLDCFIHERDFIPGRNIQDSISRCMQMSKKVVLFFTPNFLKSGYCQYESKLALNMSMEIDGNMIIPVMLENCQIPSALKTLTYIESGSKNLAESIMEAYRNAVRSVYVLNNNGDTDILSDDFNSASSTAPRKLLDMPWEAGGRPEMPFIH